MDHLQKEAQRFVTSLFKTLEQRENEAKSRIDELAESHRSLTKDTDVEFSDVHRKFDKQQETIIELQAENHSLREELKRTSDKAA